MNILLFLAFVFFVQDDVPFKNDDEFQIEIDLKFKPRPVNYKVNTYSAYGSARLDRNNGGEIPFLIINVRNLKIQPDEIKMKAVDSSGKTIFKRKSSAKNIRFEMGFLEELKNGDVPNQISIIFLSAEKRELRKIVLSVLKDGTFLVNGKWHGKF